MIGFFHICLICLIYLVLVNLIAFFMMRSDKIRAKRGHWRIREKTLFLPVVLGGAIGGTIGMHHFHHKTNHWYFRYGFPLIGLVEYAFIVYFFIRIIFVV